MTNTGIYVPQMVEQVLLSSRDAVRRIELSKRYVDEAELQGLASDESFLGVDLVLLGEDYMVTVDIQDWMLAQVQVTMSRIVPDEEMVATEIVWKVDLVEVPWQVFSRVLASALEELAKTVS